MCTSSVETYKWMIVKYKHWGVVLFVHNLNNCVKYPNKKKHQKQISSAPIYVPACVLVCLHVRGVGEGWVEGSKWKQTADGSRWPLLPSLVDPPHSNTTTASMSCIRCSTVKRWTPWCCANWFTICLSHLVPQSSVCCCLVLHPCPTLLLPSVDPIALGNPRMRDLKSVLRSKGQQCNWADHGWMEPLHLSVVDSNKRVKDAPR